MLTEPVNLATQQERLDQLLERSQEHYLELRVAAAAVFHCIYDGVTADVPADDYDRALEMAAAALSRIVPIYAQGLPDGGQNRIDVDLATHRFRNGATELRCNGSPPITGLSVARASLPDAISIIKRSRLLLLVETWKIS
jgi:hypothetical protein